MTDFTPSSDASPTADASGVPSLSVPGGAPVAPGQLLDQLKTGGDSALDQAVNDAMMGVSAADMTSGARLAAVSNPDGPGAIRQGRIANIGSQDVLIDFGGKSLGTMPLAEFGKDEKYSVGDDIEVMIGDAEPVNGLLGVSRKKARQRRLLDSLTPGMVLDGHVTGMNKGGLEVEIQGLRGFIPASQVDVRFVKDISNLIGQDIRAEVMKFEKADDTIILSRRNVQMKESVDRKEKLITEIEVGQVRRGRVRSLCEFGAFVDIGGMDALLHVTDMSWGRVTKPEEIVKVGDEIEAKIIKINKEKKKISLSLKETIPDPWSVIATKYAVGAKLSGRVVRLQEFGAFVEIEPGVDGLIPLSEMSWTKRVRTPNEVVKEGDVVDVAIIGIDAEKKRISLSLKQTSTDPWAVIAERYPVGSTIKGKVARTAEFGAFVNLEDGIDGLIHISELSEHRIKAVTDKVKPGDDVEVRVIGLDAANKKISLSMKPPPKEMTEEEKAEIARRRAAEEKEREKKKAKSASRRGGLTVEYGGVGLGSLDPSKFSS